LFVEPKRIEIIRTNQPGLSSLSLASCEAIEVVLKKHYSVRVSTVSNQQDLALVVARKPDLVFNGIKYLLSLGGKKLWISDYLESNQITHTGSPKAAVRLEKSKQLAKQRVAQSGLSTARYVMVPNQALVITAIDLKFPLFVKPASLGGGQGIDSASVVHNLGQLQAKIKLLRDLHSADILVEEYLPGREFSVAILKDLVSGQLLAMPLELVAPVNNCGDRILGQQTKSANQETVLSVADGQTRTQVVELAIRAFNALGARDYGRIDIRLDQAGIPHFLEANLIPSLIAGYGSFPRACVLNISLEYDEMILQIVDLGLQRTAKPSVVKRKQLHRFISGVYQKAVEN
jgi:D-alanine-D-alanine ligase